MVVWALVMVVWTLVMVVWALVMMVWTLDDGGMGIGDGVDIG